MTRRLLVAGAALCLVAACATTPTRPAAKTASADPFRGCRIQNADLTGFEVRCGQVAALVDAQRLDMPPAQRVARMLHEMSHGLGETVLSQEKIRLRLAGAERPATRVRLVGKKGHGPASGIGIVASFDRAPHRAVTVFCIGDSKDVAARCPALLDRMAAHPTTPPQIAGAGGTWPSKKDLARLGDCSVTRENGSMVQLMCHGDIVLLRRLALKTSDVERAEGEQVVDAISKASLAMARKKMTAAATLENVPCHVGPDATVCKRIEAPSPGSSGTIIAGAGRLFHAYALVECIHDGVDDGVPPGCAPFLHLDAGKATTVAGASAAPAAPGPSASHDWLPKKALAGLSGCAPPKWSAGQLELHCGGTYVTLGRIPKATGTSLAKTEHDSLQYAATSARDDFKAHGGANVTLTWLDCRVGSQASRCARVRFGSTDGLEETVLGAGTLYGGAMLVSCLHPAADTALPAVCKRFLQIGGEKPAP